MCMRWEECVLLYMEGKWECADVHELGGVCTAVDDVRLGVCCCT